MQGPPGAVLGWAALLTSCGGGTALLHPAHTLSGGEVAAGAGVSGTFATGETASALDAQPADGESAAIEAALLDASAAPGVAPWVAFRACLGATSEAGMTYSGRAVRIDCRHAFESPKLALSLGAGVSAILERGGDDPPFGFGFDLPVLVGYRSDASLVQAWAGVRAGFESIEGSLDPEALAPFEPELPVEFDADRYSGAAIVGLALGVRPIRVALELDVSYFAISVGSSGRPETTARGVALTPAAALIGHF